MALTIDDIYDKEFALKGGGYDRDDVDQFLDEICDEMISMQDKLTAMEADLQKARQELKMEREAVKPIPQPEEKPEPAPAAKTSETLESILLSAQRLADEAVESANKKAEEIIGRAEDEASKIVDDAQEEKQTIEKSLLTMKASAADYRKSFLEMIRKHETMLNESAELFEDDKK